MRINMPEEDYVLINGKNITTHWQKCVSCHNEIFTTSSPEESICDDCRRIDESHRGGGGYSESINHKISKKQIPDHIRWAVWERDNFTCQHCGSRKNLSIDHIYPESLGGETTIENCQTLCKSCNSKKGARP